MPNSCPDTILYTIQQVQEVTFDIFRFYSFLATCPGVEYKGHCFVIKYSPRLYLWFQADETCAKLNRGHLANVYDEQHYNKIRDYLLKQLANGEVLVGMNYDLQVTWFRNSVVKSNPFCRLSSAYSDKCITVIAIGPMIVFFVS